MFHESWDKPGVKPGDKPGDKPGVKPGVKPGDKPQRKPANTEQTSRRKIVSHQPAVALNYVNSRNRRQQTYIALSVDKLMLFIAYVVVINCTDQVKRKTEKNKE